MLEGSHIVVTGGTGFVGAYLLAALQESAPDARVTVVSRDAPVGGTLQLAGAVFVELDLADQLAIDETIAALSPDIVVHLAAQSSVGNSAGAAALTWDVNFKGTDALARAVGRHVPTATFLNVSTGEVYGRSFLIGVADEETPPLPNSPYARSKFAAELLLPDILPSSVRLILARPFNHTGPGQDERFVVPSLAAQIARLEADESANTIRVGNLDAKRDFLDVRDVVAAYLRLLECAADLPMRSCFNIASGKERAIGEILDFLRANARKPIVIEQDPGRMRPSEIESATGSSARLTAATGWTSTIPFEDTLADVLTHERSRVLSVSST
jgi:GDP-4-dehydro-6-deoxy-D-mannose reductase